MKKKVAVVILNWNGKELMERFLPSVIAHSPENLADVVVADNGSNDGSIEMLQTKFPQVRIIKFEENYGFAGGYNRALEKIEADYTVLLNSDVEVTPRWLQRPLELLESDKNIAGLQPKILAERNRSYFEYAGAAGGYMDKYGYPFCRGRLLHIVEEDKGQYDKQADLLWATGACLFIRTKLYKEVGGLDEGFFAHQEEIDLCWRIRSRGYRLVCCTDSVVYHVGGATLQAESPRKTFLNFRNNLLMLYKNLSDGDLKQVMRVRRILDYVAAAKFMLSGHPQNALAVYKARRAFHKLLPEYKQKREENRRRSKPGKIPELLDNSLIRLFYLKGIRTFQEIEHYF